MATHDYVISNASGAAVRADLNNALAAIVSNNSNATEPSTTYAYQWWADIGSSPAVMKLRNAANDGWITLFQLDGEWSTIALEDGTAAAPSLYFKDSGTDTGFFSGGTDQVNVTTAGIERVEWGTSEVVFNDGGENYDFRIEGDTNSSLFFVDASTDRVGIGTTSPARLLTLNATEPMLQFTNPTTGTTANDGTLLYQSSENFNLELQDSGFFRIYTGGSERVRLDSSGRLLVGTSSTSAATTVLFQGNSSSSSGEGMLHLSRGTNAPTDGANLGVITFTDSNHGDAAYIYAVRDGGTWNTSTSRPTRLVFSTTPDSAASPVERLRITQSGAVAALGVFNVTTATAANVNVDSNGLLQRSTSSAKYKANIETLQDEYADALLQCRPVWYQSTCKQDNPSWGWWGFIAEEVAAIDPRLVHWKTVEITYDEKGSVVETPCDPEPEGVQYDRFVPHLLNLIKRQKEQIEAMEARLTALETP